MILRLSVRNLLRHRWRTALTAGGIAFAVAVMVWMLGLMDGFMQSMVRGATALDSGQVLVQTADYVDEPAAYKTLQYDPGDFDETLDAIAGLPEVAGATARVRLYGLVGDERRSQVAQIIGVDAGREAAATPIDEAITRGRWLSEAPPPAPAAREVVLGDGLFKQLDTSLGAELVVFLEASDGSLGNELLEVVGVVKTGDARVDRRAAYLHLEGAQFIGALDGQVHEVAVRLESPELAPEAAGAIQAAASDLRAESPVVARPWQQVKPELAQLLETADISYLFLYVIVYLVAALGIFNTQRMSALERRREFGVMMAVGVSPSLLFRIVVAETVVLAMIGGAAGAVVGAGLTYWMEVAGLELASFGSGAEFSMMGVSFSDRLYAELGLRSVVEPLAVLVATSVLIGLGPAVQAIRTDLTSAIAGRD